MCCTSQHQLAQLNAEMHLAGCGQLIPGPVQPYPHMIKMYQDVLFGIGSEESLAQGYISAISLKILFMAQNFNWKAENNRFINFGNRHFCRFVPTVYLILYLAIVL